MPNLVQIKLERLRAQAERDIITNEITKGTLVRWVDVLAFLQPKVADARNLIMSWPSMLGDRLTREEVEYYRKALYAILEEVSKIGLEDVKLTKRSPGRPPGF